MPGENDFEELAERLQAADPATIAETTYQALRDLIRQNAYPPGTTLSENGLAKQLKVGRTPVREAAVRLTHEGLITRHPKRGMVINSLSVEDIRELYQAREILEAFCVRVAAKSMSKAKIDEMGALIDEAKAQTEKGIDWIGYRRHDRLFHLALAEAGKNKRVVSYLDSLFDAAILDPYFKKVQMEEFQYFASVEEHTAIWQAIADRDPDRAEEATRMHARTYCQRLSERLFGLSS